MLTTFTNEEVVMGSIREINTKKTSGSIALLCSLVFIFVLASRATAQECGCNICHGNPPIVDNSYGGPTGLVVYPLTGATSAGAHAIHTGPTTSQNQNPICYRCHSGGMPYSPMCGTNQLHMGFGVSTINGGVYDGRALSSAYSYQGTNGLSITANGTQQCSNIYCHGDGTGGTSNQAPFGNFPLFDPRPIVSITSPSWTYKGTLSCNSCHGYPPGYATNSPKSNTHLWEPHEQPCNFCHSSTTSDGVTITNPLNHANGIYDVTPDPTASYLGTPINFVYSYDPGGGTCSNVSCHPNQASLTWGDFNESVLPIYPTYGPACYQVNIANVSFGSITDPPYTFNWNFGDGTVGAGLPVSHVYSGASTYTVTLTGRDNSYHPFTQSFTVTPQSANVPPVESMTYSIHRNTITITDESYDSDANTCGHSGNGAININWDGNTAWTRTPVDLSVPTNTQYTYTYPLNGSFKLKYYVYDNSGAVASSVNTVAIPGPIVISGTVTHQNGSPYSGVKIYLFVAGQTGALTSATTDANGKYTLSRTWTSDCYDVHPLASGFTPSKYTYCDNSTSANFVGP